MEKCFVIILNNEKYLLPVYDAEKTVYESAYEPNTVTERLAITMEHNLESILESLPPDGILSFTPLGTSMFPLFSGGRDQVCVTPVSLDHLRRADVVLYRRDNGMLVIHRIWKIKKDGFYMVGDNQTQPEGPLRPQQIKAIMVSVRRKGKEISCNHIIYVLYSHIWLFLRPVRHIISRPLGTLYHFIHSLFPKQ